MYKAGYKKIVMQAKRSWAPGAQAGAAAGGLGSVIGVCTGDPDTAVPSAVTTPAWRAQSCLQKSNVSRKNSGLIGVCTGELDTALPSALTMPVQPRMQILPDMNSACSEQPSAPRSTHESREAPGAPGPRPTVRLATPASTCTQAR